eukprot:gnl/TRDRNA2_/TRDRNA2_175580_c1_seq2.p1 gnl/TRDRNA2_/TRDRNA2_175580_c1~~gnl/TRDRNA2_/TRDRNA2_175580_c1_seq2.p1  ORF type:complete len:712 (+),score=158.56 gnl/TRDRNA2_/TRDRNA2_175580_c1_seq2:61-2196(+)
MECGDCWAQVFNCMTMGDTQAKPTGAPVKPASKKAPGKSGPQSTNFEAKSWMAMGRYKMGLGKDDCMGEGSSSICWKAMDTQTNTPVAVKVYKKPKDGKEGEKVNLQKFRRQIQVLKELMEPLQEPADKRLWNEELANTKSSRLFMQLLDYSKDASGQPGPDPTDGVMYVITELAHYSMKDYIESRQSEKRPLSKDAVRDISKEIILVVAGLHAKGLVHIDLKPENLMMFNGQLKLIDVDGCVKIGTSISIQDCTISFSPCYCAPEWASFLIDSFADYITISPALDVWSIGITICELVTLDPILKQTYANFLRNGRNSREAAFLFMDWLSTCKEAPIPRSVEKFDDGFVGLLRNGLLVVDNHKRKSMAECLKDPYYSAQVSEAPKMPGEIEGRVVRLREEDQSKGAPVHTGTLWKLNVHGDATNKAHWLQRDMWITNGGALCYWSIKESKRLVYLDHAHLVHADIKATTEAHHPFSFVLKYPHDVDHANETTTQLEEAHFACESAGDRDEWIHQLNIAKRVQQLYTMQLDKQTLEDLHHFKLQVHNRRQHLDQSESKDKFQPVFKDVLWKVKTNGDSMGADSWFEREMWITKNGSLVYWSKKEKQELVYYTSSDLAHADITKVPDGQSYRPFAFQVQLREGEGIEFTPGEFAAVSAEARDKWIKELQQCKEISLKSHQSATDMMQQRNGEAKRAAGGGVAEGPLDCCVARN